MFMSVGTRAYQLTILGALFYAGFNVALDTE
jgi:hypothetical protein